MLKPKLINLTVEQRRALPKIGDKTIAFDEKCQMYASHRPELVPNYADTAELGRDRTAVGIMAPWLSVINPLCAGVDDTLSQLQTDICMFDLTFLQSVKQAAKRGVPGTDTICNDLRQRFPGRPPSTGEGGGGGNPPPSP